MKIKKSPPPPQIFDLSRPWGVDCILLAPDPTGYQAVLLDEAGTIVARSLREPAPIDFANRKFTFVFVPPITLDYTKHTYRIAVEGPSGIYVPFEGVMPDDARVRVGCSRCKGTGITTDTKMQCQECLPKPYRYDPNDIPF